MALWHCGHCSTAFAVGLEKCPQCGTPSQELTTLPEASSEEREHPGAGEPMGEGIKGTPDGTEREHELTAEEPKSRRRKSNG